MNKTTLFAAAVLSLAAFAAAQPYDTWNRYREIVINTTDSDGGADVAGSVEDFPVLVRLNNFGGAATGANVLNEALSGGADVRFTTADGSTALDYQIDTWSATEAAIWVRVPNVAGDDNTTIRIYWGKAGETSESDGAAVFDTDAGFTGVWHLGESGAEETVANATASEGMDFTGHPQVLSVPGIAGNARYYSEGQAGGTEYYIDEAENAPGFRADGENTMMTFSLWANRQGTGTSVSQGIFGQFRYSAGGNRSWALMHAADGGYNVLTSDDGGGDTRRVTTSTNWPDEEWHQVTVTINSTAEDNVIRIFVNGEAQETTGGNGGGGAAAVNVVTSEDGMPLIGALERAFNQMFEGYIDEIQFSNGVIRSEDWIKLTYEIQKAGATAVTLGETEAVQPTDLFYPLKHANYLINAEIDPNVPETSDAASDWSIDQTLPDGLSFDDETGVISGTPTEAGESEEFIVSATVGGESASDTITIAVSAGIPPNSPTGVAGEMGSGEVTVSWSAPLVTGSAPIASYIARAVEDTTKTCEWETGDGDLTCTVTGLENGTEYTFEVIAVSGVGGSEPSAPSAPVTPATTPDEPTDVVAALLSGAGTNATATVSWTAPESDGGLPVNGTFVFGSPSGACFAQGEATSCTVANLQYETEYTFQAYATNSAGNGDTSDVSEGFTPVNILPGSFSIHANGNPYTFVLSQDAVASTEAFTMTINDIWGRTVWSRTIHPAKDDLREISWNGRNSSGRTVSAGMYMVRVSTVSGKTATNFIQKTVRQ